MGDRGEPRRPLPPAGLATHAHLWAALALGLVVFGYLWPVLVGGKILSPIADLYQAQPWQSYAPADVGRFQNGLLIDLPVVQYPWRTLVRQLLHEGSFPAWNRYVMAGIPLYSNPQTGVFSIFNLPLWTLSLTYALGVSAAAKLFVGAFGTYMLVRQLGMRFLPGLLAGVAFAFSAINIVWLAHETLVGVVVMLPWALLLIERIFTDGRRVDALGLALVVALALGGGHPGMQVHFLVVAALYLLVRAVWPDGAHDDERVSRRRALALAGGAVAGGTLLMAFMLLPEALSSHDTVGVAARRAGSLAGQRVPFDAIQTVAFPDRWGRPSAFENVVDRAHNPFGIVNYNERTFYAGVVALLFAAIGLVARGGWARKGPFLVLAVVGLAVPLRMPGLYWLATHLPILDSVEAQRLHFAFELATAVLAAFGLQALLTVPRGEGRRRAVVMVLAAIAGGAAIATADATGADLGNTLNHFTTGADHATSGVLALTSAAWFLLFALGVGIALLLARVRPDWRMAAATIVVALAIADAYHFARGYQPMGPASKLVPPKTPAIAYLQRHQGDARMVGVDAMLPPDTGLLYGLRDVRGYDPPQPTRQLLDLWLLANPRQRSEAPLEVPLSLLTPRAINVLGVLGARHLAFPPGFQLARAWRGSLAVVYDGSDATILENRRAAPRVFLPARVMAAATSAQARRRIAERGFDPATMATVEAGPSRPAPAAARGSGSIRDERNAGVTLDVRLSHGGLVVLDDALMQGWSVRVDGRPAQPLRVDDVLRGVAVPRGRHEVVWSYATPGLRAGVLLSLLAALGLAGGFAVHLVRVRRAELARR